MFHHLATAVALLKAYTGHLPLAVYLKQYFALHRKHGSKDRRQIAQLCYVCFRLGHALPNLSIEERIQTGLFLCTPQLQSWAALYDDAWVAGHSPVLEARIAFVQQQYPFFAVEQVFPWLTACSSGIAAAAFAQSHLLQPKVFLRIRPGHQQHVVQLLQEKQVLYEQPAAYSLALPPHSKVEALLPLNRCVVVQDYSSQQVRRLLEEVLHLRPGSEWKVWDCCAASGGKSILAADVLPGIRLTVSDIRPSILHNLKLRFQEAGITAYQAFVADLAQEDAPLPRTVFDLVICDAPCSGSGTWGRTPEQLYFFTPAQLEHYVQLQRSIVNRVVPSLQEGCFFLYITCSVFAKENEAMCGYLQEVLGLQLLRQELLTGYTLQADTMFAALFRVAGSAAKRD